jgi:predicted transcriptional regulator YheO
MKPTEEQITEEALKSLYSKLDSDDERFLKAAIVMMLKAVADKSGMLLIVPNKDGDSTGMLCSNMDSKEIYEELSVLAEAMMEDLGTSLSPRSVQ